MKKFTYLLTISIALIYESLNAQWKPQVKVLPAPNTASISISAVDSNVVWTLSIDLSQGNAQGDPTGPMNRFTRSTNGGKTCLQDTIMGAKGLHPGSITAIDSMTAWVAMQDESFHTSGGIFKTTDGGTIWTKQSTAFAKPGGKPVFIYFFDADSGVLVGESDPNLLEIYTTTNGGTQWDSVPRANIPPKQVGEELREGFEFSVYHKTFWFCTSGPAGRIFKSTDRGHNWTVASAGTGFDRVHSIAFQDDSIGLACAFKGSKSTIIRTTNGGNTWFPVATPVTPTPHIICYVPGTPGSYVVVGHFADNNNTGTAITLNGGSSWKTVDNISYGLLAFATNDIGWAVGGTSFSNINIYRWSGPALVTPDEVSSLAVPAGISLEQNYPNPFNSSTKISYQVPVAENVSLTVYDILGKEVSSIVKEKKPAGSYEVEFEAKGLPGGLYFYKLQAGTNAEIKKMTILK
jgi:photosystem II stability/assembly factor-like uncharacterized protein